MLLIEFFNDINLVTNLLTFVMFQFFLGVGIGIYLGTEYDFKVYIDTVKGLAAKIEKRTDNIKTDKSPDTNDSNGWTFFGGAKKDKTK